MNYEKAYKDAVSKIKSIIADKKKQGLTNCLFEGDLNEIFPELAKSENEINKDIIAYMRYERKSSKEEIENRFIPWLEKQGEQKHVWSEEDEKYCRCIIDFYLQKSYGATAMAIEWLENLKNRVQPQWKPTVDQMQSLHFAVITYSKKDDYKLTYDSLNSLYNDLKKL